MALQVAVVTLFPELVRGASEHGVLGRALARGLAGIECVDPRQYASDAHRTVDDRPYGGGPGMVGTPAPWAAAIDAAVAQSPAGVPRIHLSAQGERFDQGVARELAAMPGFVLVASRYEGLDQRLVDSRIDRELSIGDFVLSGGEFAALAVIDAVVRLLPGALGDERSSEQESFTEGRLDWPHYTRPLEWEGRAVPAVLAVVVVMLGIIEVETVLAPVVVQVVMLVEVDVLVAAVAVADGQVYPQDHII